MNRRSFIGSLAGALAGFAVLPPATTYARVWAATRKPVWVIDWSVIDMAALRTHQHGLYDFLVGRQGSDNIRRDATKALVRYRISRDDVKICAPSPSEMSRIFMDNFNL